MFKVNDTDASLGRRSGVFIVNFEHISHLKHIYIPSQTNVASSSLPKRCRWSEFFWSVFSCIRTVYENIRIHSECGKIRTRKTPNMDTFHAVFNAFQFSTAHSNDCWKAM